MRLPVDAAMFFRRSDVGDGKGDDTVEMWHDWDYIMALEEAQMPCVWAGFLGFRGATVPGSARSFTLKYLRYPVY